MPRFKGVYRDANGWYFKAHVEGSADRQVDPGHSARLLQRPRPHAHGKPSWTRPPKLRRPLPKLETRLLTGGTRRGMKSRRGDVRKMSSTGPDLLRSRCECGDWSVVGVIQSEHCLEGDRTSDLWLHILQFVSKVGS